MQHNDVHTIVPNLLQLCLQHMYHSLFECDGCEYLFYVNTRVHEGLRFVNIRCTSAELSGQGRRRLSSEHAVEIRGDVIAVCVVTRQRMQYMLLRSRRAQSVCEASARPSVRARRSCCSEN